MLVFVFKFYVFYIKLFKFRLIDVKRIFSCNYTNWINFKKILKRPINLKSRILMILMVNMTDYKMVPVKEETKKRLDNFFPKSMTYDEMMLWFLDNCRKVPFKPFSEFISLRNIPENKSERVTDDR